MISIKTQQELEVMRKACKITAAARALAGEMVRPGVTTGQIDKAVHDFILSQGATPSKPGLAQRTKLSKSKAPTGESGQLAD